MKKLFTFLLLINLLNAEMINGIAAIVENEPITLNEVSVAARELKSDQSVALEVLIKEKLKDAQIKSLNITTTNYEVEQKISQIAAQNGVSLDEFKSILASRGINYDKFKEQTSDALKQEKLYGSVFYSMRQNVSEESAQKYYNNNQELFTIFDSIDVIRYSSKDKNLLNEAKQSLAKTQEGIKSEKMSINTVDLTQKQLYLFQNTPSNEFTPILQSGNEYEMYFITSKNGARAIEFNRVKKQILSQMAEIEQKNAINEYFNKLRSKANIQLLR